MTLLLRISSHTAYSNLLSLLSRQHKT